MALDGDDAYWIESRPSEKGRSVIVRQTKEGAVSDAIPRDFNARTTVHEYGGGAYLVERRCCLLFELRRPAHLSTERRLQARSRSL